MIRLLLIEDDEDHAELARSTICETGLPIQLEVSGSASEALEALQNKPPSMPHAILLDVRMPRMNGLELLKQLKSEDLLRDIPVYMTTTSSRAQDQEASRELGASGYFVKPFLVEDIRAVYMNCLGKTPEAAATP